MCAKVLSLSSGGKAYCWFLGGLALKELHLQDTGQLWHPLGGAVFLTEVGRSWSVKTAPLPFSRGRSLVSPAPQLSSGDEQPLPGFHQIPTFTLCLSSYLPGGAALPFYLRCGWVLKLQTSETAPPPSVDPYWYFRGGFWCSVAGAGLSQEMVTQLHSSWEFMVNHSTKLVPRFATLNLHLCSYAGEWGSLMALARSFTSTEAISPLPNAL